MTKDYYKILGIERDATENEIKKAYRKKAMEYHPDKNDGDSEAENKFKEAAEAYDILSTPEKKSRYDQYGTVDGSPFGGSAFNMNDIFSNFGDIFGGFGGAFNKKYKNKGSDLRVKVSLTTDDILNGVTKKIKYKRQVKCADCNGMGGTGVETCQKCNGTGQESTVQNTPFGRIMTTRTCSVCGGTGHQIKNKCTKCNGVGTVSKEDIVDIDIPAGVSNEMVMNMNGYGNYIKNGEAGNLQIIIEEINDPRWRRDKNNFHIDKFVSIIDAIIGSDILIQTPHGELQLNIEPGTYDGQIIKIENKGIPDINYGLGDLFVNIHIKIPKNISIDEKIIIEKLRDSENFIV